MKIGIIGASGKAGSLILKEAVSRGHDVTAIVRNKTKIKDENVAIIEKDIFDLTINDLSQFDIIVNAYGAPFDDSAEELHVKAGRVLIKALSGTKTRLIVVGGVGSLYLDETHTSRVIDILPDFVRPTANGQFKNLQDLEQTIDLLWTFISPAQNFDPEGKRTGSYKKGKNHVILNSKGESYISYADYAIAVVDEIESFKHIKERFTVVGEAE